MFLNFFGLFSPTTRKAGVGHKILRGFLGFLQGTHVPKGAQKLFYHFFWVFTRGFQGPQGGGLGFQGERGQVSFRDGAFWYAGDLQMDFLFSQWAFLYIGVFRWGFLF